MRTGLARLGEEGRAKSGRDAEVIAATGSSMMPDHLAGLWDSGENGKAQVVNLMDQLSKRGGSFARQLKDELEPRIPAAERGLFQASSVLRKLADEDEEDPDEPDEPDDPDEPP